MGWDWDIYLYVYLRDKKEHINNKCIGINKYIYICNTFMLWVLLYLASLSDLFGMVK